MIMNQYIADDLANKVVHLYELLNKAQNKIDFLEQQNAFLSDVLHNLTSLNKEDYEEYFEGSGVQ